MSCNSGLETLEFQNVHLDVDEYDVSIWSIQGAQVKGLRFSDCTIDKKTFLYIAKHCVNLESLYWYGENLICSCPILDYLHSKDISRENVRSF